MTAITDSGVAPAAGRPARNWQPVVTGAVVLAVSFVVLLPLVFLVGESLNVGDALTFPPEEYGISNYIEMFQEDLYILTNTVSIAVMATVMAILIGFTLAWILTRTNGTNAVQLDSNSTPTPYNIYVDQMTITYQ